MESYLSKHMGAQIDNAVESVIDGVVADTVNSVQSNWRYSLEISDASDGGTAQYVVTDGDFNVKQN